MSTFPTITLQDLKKHGTKALPKRQVAYLIVNSRMHSVVVPFDDYEALMEIIEDFEDMQAVEERRDEKAVPLEKAFPNAKYGRRSVSR